MDANAPIHFEKGLITSKIIFPEKSLSVRMIVCLFVCLSVPSVPSRPVPKKKSLKQKTLLNKVVRYISPVTSHAGRGKAELRIFDFKTTL